VLIWQIRIPCLGIAIWRANGGRKTSYNRFNGRHNGAFGGKFSECSSRLACIDATLSIDSIDVKDLCEGALSMAVGGAQAKVSIAWR
jgi:hypothetical protein